MNAFSELIMNHVLVTAPFSLERIVIIKVLDLLSGSIVMYQRVLVASRARASAFD